MRFCLGSFLLLLATATAADTSADPTVAIAAIDPGIIEGYQLMTVKLDVADLDEESGFLVNIERSDSGHIAAGDSVNPEIFRQRMSEALRIIR